MYLTGTGRRLLLAFGLLVVLFGTAAALASRGLSDMRENLGEVRREEQRVRTVLQLANAVRDQYAHQAHMILLGNDSHLAMYRAAHARVNRLTRRLASDTADPEDLAEIGAISKDSEALNESFLRRILPAVRAGDSEAAKVAHDEVLAKVLSIQERADTLSKRYEASIASFEKAAQEVQRRTYLWALGLFGAGTLFAIIVGLYLGRSIARPVVELEAGAARLAAGDLDTRITLDRDDEFGRLARQFNAMTEAVKQHQVELVRHERLAGVGRLAAGVAHEINNPLAVILGYVRLMQKRGADGFRDDLKVIEEEVLRGKEIVEGLLDLSRPWDAGGDPLDLGEAARSSVARIDEAGVAAGVRLEVHGEARLVTNPRAVRQILANLVRNAVDAAGEGGQVRVDVSADDDEARVDVTDTGPGVEAAQLEQIFEPFYTTKPAGTGLGLAVSRAIAAALGGRIEVDTERTEGATFSLVLPAAPMSPAETSAER